MAEKTFSANGVPSSSPSCASMPVHIESHSERIVEGTLKIKVLPPSVVKDIEQKNIARRMAGLAPIRIRVRRCLACGSHFESSGNRTCGCSSRTAGMIAGREII